ncbi:glucuronate isomerase [Psychrobacillus psychrotolerans]
MLSKYKYSRSYVSYLHHEYFRRILCNFTGERVEIYLLQQSYGVL